MYANSSSVRGSPYSVIYMGPRSSNTKRSMSVWGTEASTQPNRSGRMVVSTAIKSPPLDMPQMAVLAGMVQPSDCTFSVMAIKSS